MRQKKHPELRLKAKDIKSLEKNDLVLIRYGYDRIKVRVIRVFGKTIYGHSITWCKSDAIMFPYNKYGKDEIYYVGKMSKLRAFFML